MFRETAITHMCLVTTISSDTVYNFFSPNEVMEKDDLFTYPDKKSVSTSFITNFTDKDLISIQKTAKREV